MIIGIMSITQATLTLPGIAGLILTLAVAVDANVLIYERMRDELRAGRSLIASMDAGFSRAMGTILDANMTHILSALIMFQFGSGPGKRLRLDPGHRRPHDGVLRRPRHPSASGLVVPRHPPEDPADRLRDRDHEILAPDQGPAASGPTSGSCGWRAMSRSLSVLAVIGSLASIALPFTPPCGGLDLRHRLQGRHGDGDFNGAQGRRPRQGRARRSTGMRHRRRAGAGRSATPTAAMVRFQTPRGRRRQRHRPGGAGRADPGARPGAGSRAPNVVGAKVSGELLSRRACSASASRSC